MPRGLLFHICGKKLKIFNFFFERKQHGVDKSFLGKEFKLTQLVQLYSSISSSKSVKEYLCTGVAGLGRLAIHGDFSYRDTWDELPATYKHPVL